MSLDCKLAGRCSGCPWIQIEPEEQTRRKLLGLRERLRAVQILWPDSVEIRSAGSFGLRDRADLTLEKGRLGLFELAGRDIADMDACPMMSPNLEAWLKDFRKNLPLGIQKGSIRLRVGPDGRRGLWLDFANVDIKGLLEEKNWLLGWMESGVVIEIGQKRKRLVLRDEKLKLGEPQTEVWFETYLPEPIGLKCHIADFTQPSMKINRLLVETAMDFVRTSGAKRWQELGSGIGNFTLPLARIADSVVAVEMNRGAIVSLEENLKKSHLDKKVKTVCRDFRKLEPGDLFDGVLCDPPRSGMGSSLDVMGAPSVLIYISCFEESLARDAVMLQEKGYVLTRLTGVDQFPQSSHCEFVGMFQNTESPENF